MGIAGRTNDRPVEKRSRPRLPRLRADYRRVAGPNYAEAVIDIPDYFLSETALIEIAAASPYLKLDDNLRRTLRDLANQHRAWIDHPIPSKSRARYDLKLIAYLAERIEDAPKRRALLTNKLRMALGAMNSLARGDLWCALTELRWAGVFTPFEPADWCSQDFAALQIAADRAAARIKGGDYTDASLFLTVGLLMDAFRAGTGRKPTYWPERPRITQSDITGSSCGRMILAFFRHVEPTLSERRISNVHRSVWTARRSGGGDQLIVQP